METTLRTRLKKQILRTAYAATAPITETAKRVHELGMHLQFQRDWGVAPNPEWFNHDLDFALFATRRQPHFFERGVYASEIVGGKRVLDVCCGDGSVAALFIAPQAKSVLGVDFDPNAIKHARKRWSEYENCRFELMDIRKLDVHAQAFDVILWDAAIEHFTQDEIDHIFGSLKRCMTSDGILHGSSIKKREQKSHHDHEYEFATLQELKAFLGKYFRHVEAWERTHPDRTSLYFRCSDVPLMGIRGG